MELTKEKRQELLKLPTGNIADNNNSLPHQGVMDSGIKPLDPTCKMIGRAYTVQCYPGDNLALHEAIYAANPGDVLVLDCGKYTEGGHFGDVMATACLVRGIAGVVIDGSCRDAEDIKALKLPVFVRALNPAGTVKDSLGKLGAPVSVGGITVHTGDIVFGDCDGVVIIPKDVEDQVFAKALEKFDKEITIVQELKAGKTTLEIMGFDKKIAAKHNNA